MNRLSETRISWTKLIVALVLSCAISSFSVMAQTVSDKPLDAKSLANLVKELKGIVSGEARDEKKAAAVAKKWDKRKDLAGKTKKDVINLLWADVKSVIKDSGVLYQINSQFSFYKRIPDEQFSAEPQKTDGTATAKTDSGKPLDANSLANLVKELKEVVATEARDEKAATAVAQKWDARTDLAGKTKKEVISLLFQDVRAVIEDSGVLYQIYSQFSLYQQMPDEQFSTPAQKPKGAMTKPASVDKLIELTFSMHPYVGVDEQIASLPGTEDIRAEEERIRKVRLEVFDEALKVNNQLTPDQKSFVKANYDRLSKIVDNIIDETIKTNFPTEHWVKESLRQNYTAKFSLKELKSLVVYFQGTAGQQVLKYVRISKMAELITGNGGQLDYTAEDKREHDKFASNPLGKKFMTAFIADTEAYEKRKVNTVMAGKSNADGFAILEPANLNDFFNKFVSENYKA